MRINLLSHRSLSLGQFFQAVKASGNYWLKFDESHVRVCGKWDPKAQRPIYTVKNCAGLPEKALFSRGERRELAHYFYDLKM